MAPCSRRPGTRCTLSLGPLTVHDLLKGIRTWIFRHMCSGPCATYPDRPALGLDAHGVAIRADLVLH